jgi:hypothetical protein
MLTYMLSDVTASQSLAIGASLVASILPWQLAWVYRAALRNPERLQTARARVVHTTADQLLSPHKTIQQIYVGRTSYTPSDKLLLQTDMRIVTDVISQLQTGKPKGTVTYSFESLYSALKQCTDLWDHGHVRPIKPADAQRYTDFAKQSHLAGEYSIALMYASKKAPDEPIMLGVARVQPVLKERATTALSNAKHAGISLHLDCLPGDQQASVLAKQHGITLHETALVSKTNGIEQIATIISARRFVHATQTALQSAITTFSAQLALVAISFYGLVQYHIAPAITAPLLVLAGLSLILPCFALHDDKVPAKYLIHTTKITLPDWRKSGTPLALGAYIALLCYGAYLFYFARMTLRPEYLDPSLPMYHIATTVACVSLVLCLYAHLLFERAKDHKTVFTSHLHANNKLLQAFAISLIGLAIVIYTPWLQTLCNTGPLSVIDWVTALLCASLYSCIRLLQRFTSKYTRDAVVKLHREVHG